MTYSRFKDLTATQRRSTLAQHMGIDPTDLEGFETGHLSVDAAEHMVENVIGVFALPIGVASNLVVNGTEVYVPMVTEEPSVIAAASNGARMAKATGGFWATSTGPVMQAQVQVVDVVDTAAARLRLLEAREELLSLASAQDPRLAEVGGGAIDLIVRTVDAGSQTYVVCHLVVDVRDAMGANAVNTMAEAAAPRIAEIAHGRCVLRILTNKADRRLVRVRAVLTPESVGGAEVLTDMAHASLLAQADPYRAATHNKGIMNGVSAVVLATGNDTRAVEAGAHAHAAATGRYMALSRFERDADDNLACTLELPMPVGLVGGATVSHPGARVAVRIIGAETATRLGEIIAALGLAQNIAAVRALSAEGIQRGHMSLHARNIAVMAGAKPHEIAPVVDRLVEQHDFRIDHAEGVLAALRSE